MIDNGNDITENIFDMIVNNYNSIFNQNNYTYNKDITYQNIIIRCFNIIFAEGTFGDLDTNFLFDNVTIKNKYENIFKYQEYEYEVFDLEDGYIEYSYMVYCPKHIIMKYIIDNGYYIHNNLITYIFNYIDNLCNYNFLENSYHTNILDENYIRYKINENDNYSGVYISIKKFLDNNNIDRFNDFNINLKRYLNIIYSILDKFIDYNSFRYGLINYLFDKKLFLNIFNNEFIVDHICVFEYCDNDIYNFLLEYLRIIPDNNDRIEKINNILNRFVL